MLDVKCYICESKKKGCFFCGYIEMNPECNPKNKNCKNCGVCLEPKLTEIKCLSPSSRMKEIAKHVSKVNFCDRKCN